MTKEQFVTAVEAKSNFIKWAQTPSCIEKYGDIEKWCGIAYITTPDGTNTYNVWYMVDTSTNTATWQNHDTMEPEKNTSNIKMAALTNYLKANFDAYFIVPNHLDLDNNWAEAEVLKLTTGNLVRSKVLIFKKGTNPISHLVITN